MAAPASRISISVRLVLAMAVVVLVATGVMWLVASLISPYLFHEHMVLAGAAGDSSTALHAEAAFRSATGISLGASLAVAGLTALVLAIIVARRLARPLTRLADTVRQAGEGDFRTPVTAPGSSSEINDVIDAFNELADRLQRSQHLRQQLFTDVAHELRTPAATLSACLDSIEDGVRSLDDDTTTVMRRQIERITRLAGDMSAVMRAENQSDRMDLRPISPAALLDDARSAFAERCATAGITVTTTTQPGLPEVAADPQRINQVLGNLLDNALHHTPAGGEIRLSAAQAGQEVRFSVADSGDGIADHDLPYLFERFYRADQSRDRNLGGSGVGLAIVKAIVEAHHGTVGVSSDGPGQGSVFSFSLPV